MIVLGITGNLVVVTATFKQLGVIADPAGTITFTLRKGDGITTLVDTYGGGQIIKDSTGVYHRQYVCDTSGEYVVNVTAGAGNGQASDDAVWYIAKSALFS